MSEKPPIADTIRMMDIVDRLQRLRNDGARVQQGDEALLAQVRQIYVEQGLEVDHDIINKAFFELRGRAPQALVPVDTNASQLFKLQNEDDEEDLFNEAEASEWEDDFLTEELSDLLPEDEWGDELHAPVEKISLEPGGFEMVVSAAALTTVLLSAMSGIGWALDQFKTPALAPDPVTCAGSEMSCTADLLVASLAGPLSWVSLFIGAGFALMTLHGMLALWRPGRKHRLRSIVGPSLGVALFVNLPLWLSWASTP